MMSYFLSLMALPLLCVFWIVFQGWLARQDSDYKGYKAGCGGCTRSCTDGVPEASETQIKEQKSL